MNPWDFDRGFFDWLANGDEVEPSDASDIALLLMQEARDSDSHFWVRMGQLVLDLSGNLDAPL